VPTPNVSVIDFKFVAKRATTKDEINGAVKRAAEQHFRASSLYRGAQRLQRLQPRRPLVRVRQADRDR
jgi:glyceraldehyde-3-phosphate dehydrogenase/erythrose-4-phosphate dehydrogenase